MKVIFQVKGKKMKIVSLEQRSPDWLTWRACGIGSSDAPVIWWGKHFSTTVRGLWKEKVKKYKWYQKGDQSGSEPKERKINTAMQMGIDREPEARSRYEQITGISMNPVCGIHREYDFLKVSLDGWEEERRLLIELKCPGVRWDGSSDHQLALDGFIPEKYKPQLRHQILVSNPKKVHYVSFGDPQHFNSYELIKVLDFTWEGHEIEDLLRKELKFWKAVVENDFSLFEGDCTHERSIR